MISPSWAERSLPLPLFAVTWSALTRFALATAAIAVLPFILDNPYFVTVLQGIAITYIVVLGLNVLMGFAGLSSFGQVGFVAIAAYGSVFLVKSAKLPFWLSLASMPVLAALAGVLVALPALRARGPFLVMITAAFGLAAFSIANTWLPVTGGPMGIFGIPRPTVGEFRFDDRAYFYLVAFVALIAHALVSNLLGSRWGRTMMAVRDAPLAAATLGINVNRWKIAAFALSAYLAGLSGVFQAHRNLFMNSESFTFAESLGYILAAVFGGVGSIYGPIVGTLVLETMPHIFAGWHDYLQFIKGGLLIFLLLVMPQGIVGSIEQLAVFRRRWERNRALPALEPWAIQSSTSASPSEVLLECSGTSRSFGGLRAVDDVSVSVKTRTIHGLIGPNGSGKSTLVNIVSGVYLPSAGSVHLAGRDIGRSPAHEVARLGAVRTFQTPQLFAGMTVLENVLVGFHSKLSRGFWSHLVRTRGAVAEDRHFAALSLGLLDFFGLADRAMDPAASLPYGLQKLLEIARGLALDPSLLILDEPAGGTNPSESERIVEVLRDLRAAGVTVMVIEHHMDLIAALCDQVTVLDFGRKIAEGTPAEVLRDPHVIEAYLGVPENLASAGVTSPDFAEVEGI